MNKMNLFESSENKEENLKTLSRRELLVRLTKFLRDSLPSDTLVFKGGLFLGEYTGVPRYT